MFGQVCFFNKFAGPRKTRERREGRAVSLHICQRHIQLKSSQYRPYCRTQSDHELVARSTAQRSEVISSTRRRGEQGARNGRAARLHRVGMPATMGMRVIMPRLSAFTERHPLLRIELLLQPLRVLCRPARENRMIERHFLPLTQRRPAACIYRRVSLTDERG